MGTVGDIVRRLLPYGTRPYDGAKGADWDQCPVWPPDAFAVAATLLDKSGVYALDRYSGRLGASGLFNDDYRTQVAEWGVLWAENPEPPKGVQNCWATLCSYDQEPLFDAKRLGGDWWDNVFRLLAAADEASLGVGFIPEVTRGSKETAHGIADLTLLAYKDYYSRREPLLPYLPNSLCLCIPPDRACVLPKSRTAQVGCTLRALSHHLALVPPITEAISSWSPGFSPETGKPFNLLLVPFPYRIHGTSFVVNKTPIDDSGSGSHHFRVEQRWLGSTSKDDLLGFLRRLISEAEKELGEIHGVVLPELALDHGSASVIGTRLIGDGLEFFASGISKTQEGRAPLNAALAMVDCGAEREPSGWQQAKHHRWKLDRGQICRYHLGHELHVGQSQWWEEIDVGHRTVHFSVFRPEATVCTLICEDLARLDPVQPILRAVGPNLVVALLMDGPQLERRWPGKYATVLSDDPGSAVLTLTSVGMLRRSEMPGDNRARQIALWKNPGSDAKELTLPEGAHALALSIHMSAVRNWTLDGRTERYLTRDLSLGAVHAVSHPNPEEWAR